MPPQGQVSGQFFTRGFSSPSACICVRPPAGPDGSGPQPGPCCTAVCAPSLLPARGPQRQRGAAPPPPAPPSPSGERRQGGRGAAAPIAPQRCCAPAPRPCGTSKSCRCARAGWVQPDGAVLLPHCLPHCLPHSCPTAALTPCSAATAARVHAGAAKGCKGSVRATSRHLHRLGARSTERGREWRGEEQSGGQGRGRGGDGKAPASSGPCCPRELTARCDRAPRCGRAPRRGRAVPSSEPGPDPQLLPGDAVRNSTRAQREKGEGRTGRDASTRAREEGELQAAPGLHCWKSGCTEHKGGHLHGCATAREGRIILTASSFVTAARAFWNKPTERTWASVSKLHRRNGILAKPHGWLGYSPRSAPRAQLRSLPHL